MREIICHNVIEINKEGIILEHKSSNLRIVFDECAKNFANDNLLENSKCVATRDISELTFSFYTVPKTKVIFKKHLIKDLISRDSAVNKFLDLQNAINKSGYTSYDLS